MNNKMFIALLVLAAGVLAGWFLLKGSTPNLSPGQTAQVTPTPSGSNLGAPAQAEEVESNGLDKGGAEEREVVTLTNAGFAPSPLTVKQGTTVTFVNESDNPMWVASAPHPTHTDLPGFDELTSVPRGGTYEYTFVKVGTWKYHNHMNPSYSGSVIVTK